jgi:HSP20 family molecular chaperone IbpA
MTSKEKKELEVSQKKEIASQGGEPIREGVQFVPDVDITESDEGLTLFADMPGVSREHVDIDVRDGVLTLTATVAPLAGNRNLIYHEYEVGGFQRRFNLGERIDQEKITANMNNGVLKLFLPKAAEHKPRKIEIKS